MPRSGADSRGEPILLSLQKVSPGPASLEISLELPAGYKLNGQAPSMVKVSYTAASGAGRPESHNQIVRNPRFPVTIPLTVLDGESMVQAHLVIYYCEANRETLCYFKEAQLSLPVKADKGAGGNRLSAVYKLNNALKK